jgi:FAD/FMN-containing dehydrogenase
MTPTDTLQSRLDGDVFEPGDREYIDACTLFNAAIVRKPALVCRCTSASDIVEALRHARAHDLPVAIRSGGHSAAGWSLCDDGVVLDMRSFDAISIDPRGRTARVGGGCLTGAFDRATQAHGLATTTGRVSTTGLAGFTLGGGSGWLERRFGFAVDNLLAVELVTADGDLIVADHDTHPDLFWAVRGGGGNFGVVTSLTYRLHHVGPTVTAGLLLYDGERGADVLRHLRDLTDDAPDELAAGFAYIYGPEDESIPERLRGRLAAAVMVCHSGPLDEAERELRPLRAFGPPLADFVEPMAYTDWQCAIDDPPGYRNYFTADHIDRLTDGAIDVIHQHSQRLPVGPGWTFLMRWGGAVARPPHPTPIANRNAAWVVHPGAFWSDPIHDAQATEWARSFRHDLGRFSSGGVWLNFVGDEGASRIRAAFGNQAYDRLQAVKTVYDPDNVFRSNHNVRPAKLDREPLGAGRTTTEGTHP